LAIRCAGARRDRPAQRTTTLGSPLFDSSTPALAQIRPPVSTSYRDHLHDPVRFAQVVSMMRGSLSSVVARLLRQTVMA
jgi:hypothetical protein